MWAGLKINIETKPHSQHLMLNKYWLRICCEQKSLENLCETPSCTVHFEKRIGNEIDYDLHNNVRAYQRKMLNNRCFCSFECTHSSQRGANYHDSNKLTVPIHGQNDWFYLFLHQWWDGLPFFEHFLLFII